MYQSSISKKKSGVIKYLAANNLLVSTESFRI
jgi:hypothetical protein